MKNVLIVTPFFPYPLTSGGHQAIFNGMACLKGVANVFLVHNTTESKVKKGECRKLEENLPFVKCVPYIEPSSKHNVLWVWRCITNTLKLKQNGFDSRFFADRNVTSSVIENVNGIPNLGLRELTDGFQKHVLCLIEKYAIDIVQMEMVETLGLVDVLPKNVKTVFVHHELRWVRNELLLKQINATDLMRKKVAEAKTKELEYLNRCDYIVALSEIDKKKLQNEGVSTDIITSFAVVGGERHKYAYLKERIKTLVYIGPSHHYPNYEGIMWFLRNCWNDLRGISSDYQLLIIGKWDDNKMEQIRNEFENVRFLGYVEDLYSVVKGTIEIVPLKTGSGIRMKILEAARLGIPVIATTIGAEGLPLTDGENVILADSPEEFVEGICRLQNEGLRQRLVNNMQQFVLPRYSLDALRENRRFLYI